ncbi:uncharacterized protein LOC122093080 [Macadamia integrifolia]|uniref:uncharacterized protein LOC122093080 n=1 Tax=Macadamia integrifolia TaxID=60698 RepID=UPI001C531CE4|nr:uncharacterized protein LOC122093080 [Macadamia integrifolia]
MYSPSASPLKSFSFFVSLLTSLFFQVILTVFGSFRKRCSSKWLTFLLWSAYQLADVAATACLGILTSFPGDQLNEIAPIWSSFLLLHLGGPDSITAISLIDNELYFRHSIQLLYRVGVTVYIHVKLFLVNRGNVGGSIPWFAVLIWMLLAGVSKYAERTWAFHSANMGNLRDSMLPPPNSGPIPLVPDDDHDHRKDDGDPDFIPMDEYALGIVAAPEVAPSPTPNDGSLLKEQVDFDKVILLLAYKYFCSFKCLFVDLVVPCSNNIIDTQRFFLQCPCGVAFQLIDVELRFMYDMLFTKAVVVRTSLACNLRFLRYSAILYALTVFIRSGEVSYSIEAVILFSWALVQETYEIIQMLLSEWTVVWLHNHNFKRLSTIILKLILSCRLHGSKLISRCGVGRVASETTTRNSWGYNNIMAQYNLLSFCFKDKPTIFGRILHLSSWGKSIHELGANSRNTTHIHVSNDIKDFIYQQFKERVQTSDEEIKSAEFCNPRGKWVMKRNNCLEELGWSIDVEFDQSILIWHVATDLCYYFDDLDSIECEAATLQVKVSKALSDYLLYLLLILPFMLNNKIAKIRFQDTCAAVKKLFDHVPKDKREKKNNLFSFILQRKKSSLGEKQPQDFIKRLLRSDAQVLTRDPEADRSKSVLLEAQKLAKLLTSFAVEERWKIISGVWVEMLSYAASNCSGKHHAQRLSDGGEFLTKIWLLMAHLGMIA